MPPLTTYPFYHSFTKPSNHVICSTGTRRNFVFDADRVGSSVRILFGYNDGPLLETFSRPDGPLNSAVPDVGPLTGGGLGILQYDTWMATNRTAAPPADLFTPTKTVAYTGYNNIRPADFDVSCIVKAGSGRAGIFVRGNGNPNPGGATVYFLDIAAGVVKVGWGSGDPTVILFTGTTPIVANTYYTLRIVRVVDNYTVYLNGNVEGTFTNAFSWGGFTGMFSDTSTCAFSRFSIAKLVNPTATTHTVRNYDGTIIASGSVTDDHVDILDSALTWRGRGPYGWYRFYLTGPDHGDNQWGTAYGDCSFYRVRTDSGFAANALNRYAAFSENQMDEYARATMGGLGLHRFAMSSETTGTPAANNTGPVVTAPLFKTSWVDAALSLRPRLNLGAFPDGTGGAITPVITATVALLKDSIQAWEPRNEPDYGTNGEFYVTNEFDDFRTAVKAGDPNGKVFGPGPVTYNVQRMPFINSFLDAVMSRGGTAYLDGFSVHGYNCTNGDMAMARRTLTGFKSAIQAKGYTGPLYQTEQGFDWEHFGTMWPRHGGQWTALARFMEELYGIPFENNSFWYDVSHGFNDVPMWWLSATGPGPQALPLRVMAAEIGNRSLTSQFDFGTTGNNLYAGGTWTAGDGTKTVGFLAATANLNPLLVTVAGASSLTCVDCWGNTYTVAVTAGQATVPVGELPVWVRCPVGVTVTPASLGLTPNLAATATVAATGNQNLLTRINDGVMQNFYDSVGGLDYTGADAFYSDRTSIYPGNTYPQTITLTWGAPVTANRVVVHSLPPWQELGAIVDFDIDTWDGSTWTTRYHQTRPASTTFPFTSVGGCIYETYWDGRYIYDVSFSASSISAVRVVVRGCSYGEFDDPFGAALYGGGVFPNFLEIREIQVFNVAAAPLAPRLRNPAMGGVTG